MSRLLHGAPPGNNRSIGLGKTVQVISLLAHLKESGKKGPHLIIVPCVYFRSGISLAYDLHSSSTLENWVREFGKFAPSLSVQTYYGGKDERPFLRQGLLDALKSEHRWDVLITTYNLASGDPLDRKFLRKIEWEV